jgi:hypothetical protein
MTNEERRDRTAIYMRATAWFSYLVTVPRSIGANEQPRLVKLPGIPAPALESLHEYLEIHHRDVLEQARDPSGQLLSIEERYYYLWLAYVMVPPEHVEVV